MKLIYLWIIFIFLPFFFIGCEDKEKDVEIRSLRSQLSDQKEKLVECQQKLAQYEKRFQQLVMYEKKFKELVMKDTIVKGWLTIAARGYDSYKFSLFPLMENVRIEGNFETNRRKIEVYLFDELNFKNWKEKAKSLSIYSSGLVVIDEITIPMDEIGTYYLVFYNPSYPSGGLFHSKTEPETRLWADMTLIYRQKEK